MAVDIDDELRRDVMDSFVDLSEEIEVILLSLSSGQVGQLDELFRAVHSIKGNAAMVQRQTIVDYTHSLEEVVEALRSKRFPPSELICEVLRLGMERLRDLHERDVMGRALENLQEQELEALFKNLSAADASSAEWRASDLLNALGIFCSVGETDPAPVSDAPPAPSTSTPSPSAPPTPNPTSTIPPAPSTPSVPVAPSKPKKRKFNSSSTPESPQLSCAVNQHKDSNLHDRELYDFEFFKILAMQVDKQSEYWNGRSELLNDWAQKINEFGGGQVDSKQLAVAVYLHDVGMAFVSGELIQKEDMLSESEFERVRHHPIWGYNYVVRMPGWEEAARIILEHHEFVDGLGYPNGLKNDDIHPGAKIIAIVDAFYSMTHDRPERPHRSEIVSAISEINALAGSQFDQQWVHCFNIVMKAEAKAGRI